MYTFIFARYWARFSRGMSSLVIIPILSSSLRPTSASRSFLESPESPWVDHVIRTNVFYIGKSTEPSVPAPLIEETKAFVKRDSQREQHTAVALSKPKTVLLPGSPPELAYAPPQPQQQQYYETHTSVPYTKAIGTETKKTVRMDESTENARRIVTVEQTSRVIKFGDTGFDGHVASVRQKQQAHYRVPTPKKFVQGQFRESDYESDVDSSRIRPKWAPVDSDTEEPCYRKVQPPAARSPRSLSAPVRHVASPMEFDIGPVATTQMRREETDKKIDLQQRYHQQLMASTKTDKILQPGSPPEYGFVSRNDVKKAADRKNNIHVS